MSHDLVVSARFGIANSHTLIVAQAHGAYTQLSTLLAQPPQSLVQTVIDSGLRGKGGGGAPTGAKWQLLEGQAKPRYLVVNADESEPGTFKDRHIIEHDPHLLIEGILLSCHALEAKAAYIYMRGEYRFWHDRLQSALDEAYGAGILGAHSCDITLHRGAGAYICGEKSALLESLEGYRGQPRLKPHRPEPEWLWGRATIVNNVETIASIPYILYKGAQAYRAMGTKESAGTLLFGLSGHVNRPGVYELPFGMPLLEVIETYGGGIRDGRALKAVIPGGASTPVLTAEQAKNATLSYEGMKLAGSALGTGGMIIMDESTSMVDALDNLLAFYRHESCGQCTPCREGTHWASSIVHDIARRQPRSDALPTLKNIARTINGQTICVFGPAVADVINGFLRNFPQEFA
ncbi:MAG: NADH dehydrogenase [Sulfuricurvum sp. PC08-66]|nr:MAG: NADH dehydrogenase [Sulfuricurvum sp. PC08-66]